MQSQGEILAETVETYEKELPLTRDVRYPTGRKRYGLLPDRRSFFLFISYA